MDMEQPIQITETGGRFLVTPITDTNIFTREDPGNNGDITI